MSILENYNVCVFFKYFSLLGIIGFLWYMHFEKLVVHMLESLKRVRVFNGYHLHCVYVLFYLATLYVY